MKNNVTFGKSLSFILSVGCCLLITPMISEAANLLAENGMGTGILFILALLFFLISVLTAVFVHEGGHYIFGRLTGYEFLSFRLGSNVSIKKHGAFEKKKLMIPGTAGQCIMIPSERADGSVPFVLYNLGGVIVCAIVAGISVLLFKVSDHAALKLFWAVNAAVYIISVVTNGVPAGSGIVCNDGMNTLELCRDPEAPKAFRDQFKAQKALADDIRIKDMPEEWFYLPAGEKMGNSLCATMAVQYCDRLLDERRFPEYAAVASLLVENKGNAILGLHRSLLSCDLMTVLLLLGRDEDAEKLYTPAMISFINTMKYYPTVLVARYAHWTLAKKDPAKAHEAKADFDKTAAEFPFAGEIEGCREMMALIDEKAKKKK